MFLRTPSLFKDYLGYLRTRGHTEGSRPSEMKQALAIDPRFFVHILYYHAKNMKIILQLQRKTKIFFRKIELRRYCPIADPQLRERN